MTPALTLRTHQICPSLSGSAGTVVQAAARPARQMPSAAMSGHRRPVAERPQPATSPASRSPLGIRRGSSDARHSNAGHANRLARGAIQKIVTDLAALADCEVLGTSFVDCFVGEGFAASVSRGHPMGARGGSQSLKTCADIGHFHLHHRTEAPLRWIMIRANGPVCQQVI